MKATQAEIDAFLAQSGVTAGPRAKIEGEPTGNAEIKVFVPVKTINPTNQRQQWWAVAKRSKEQHKAVALMLSQFDADKPNFASGCLVTLVRVSSGRVDKHNLGATLKTIIDAVAMWLLGGKPGQYDEDPRIDWDEFGQEKSKKGTFGVRITIRTR